VTVTTCRPGVVSRQPSWMIFPLGEVRSSERKQWHEPPIRAERARGLGLVPNIPSSMANHMIQGGHAQIRNAHVLHRLCKVKSSTRFTMYKLLLADLMSGSKCRACSEPLFRVLLLLATLNRFKHNRYPKKAGLFIPASQIQN
jgi:hypothetical protein